MCGRCTKVCPWHVPFTKPADFAGWDGSVEWLHKRADEQKARLIAENYVASHRGHRQVVVPAGRAGRQAGVLRRAERAEDLQGVPAAEVGADRCRPEAGPGAPLAPRALLSCHWSRGRLSGRGGARLRRYLLPGLKLAMIVVQHRFGRVPDAMAACSVSSYSVVAVEEEVERRPHRGAVLGESVRDGVALEPGRGGLGRAPLPPARRRSGSRVRSARPRARVLISEDQGSSTVKLRS